MDNEYAFELLIDMVSELESARDMLSDSDNEYCKKLAEKIENTLVVQYWNDNEMMNRLDFKLKYKKRFTSDV